MKKLRKRLGLARLLCCESGNAMTLVAIGLPVLIGGAGLGVDISQWYMWKRELQFAVDQAAVAGGYAQLDPSTQDSYEARAAQEFAANLSVITEFASEPTVSLTDWNGGTANAVAVSATVRRSLPFTRMFLTEPVSINASAIVEFESDGGGSVYPTCLLALDKEASAAVFFNGNPTVDSPCGLGSLSTASDSVRISGAPGSYNMGWVVTAGGVEDKHGNFASAEVSTNLSGLTDPYEGLTPPDNPTPRSLSCSSGSTTYIADVTTTNAVSYDYFQGQNTNKATPITYSNPKADTSTSSTAFDETFSSAPTNSSSSSETWTQIGGSGKNRIYERETTTLSLSYSNIRSATEGGGNMQPGTYSNFSIGCDTVLNPGVYVIDGGSFSLTGSNSLTGSGVLFVLKNGASISVAGNSRLDLTGMSRQQLLSVGVSSEDATKMEGMVIFEDPDGPGANEHKFRGTADISISGVIYTPNTPFSMLGTPRGVERCVSIAAKTIQIGGTADLINMCPSGREAETKIDTGGGARVRLVA